jgi:MFS family permease
MASAPSNSSSNWKGILRALGHRNFRLFFIGQGVSLIGTWMQQVAMGWLVWELTRKAFKVGMVTFAAQVPSLLLLPLIGVLVDRWNRHRLVIVSQTLAMVQAGVLAALVLLDVITYWQLIGLSVFLGCVNALDLPARQAFLSDMVTNREDLANAIALNSTLFNGARLVGPSLAGLLIALAGEAVCFLLNALSYVAVLVALLSMRIPRREPHAHRPSGPNGGPDGDSGGRVPAPEPHARPRHILHDLKEGFVYAFGFPPIRALILLIAMVSFLGFPYTVLMPSFADEVLHGGPLLMGLLTTAAGVGALVGALYLASRPTVLGLAPRIATACSLFGVSLIAFSHSTNVVLSLALLVPTGLGLMVTTAGCNTILQTIVEDDKRGRVMSIFMMAFVGVAPFGSLLAGAMADWIGPPLTVLIGGAACLVSALIFGRQLPYLRQLVRPIYIQKGILASSVSAIEPASEILIAQKE